MMNSKFGETFLFLTKLAWRTRLVIPVLVTTAFLIMDIRLQVEINIQTGQVAAADFMQENDANEEIENPEENESETEDEYTTDSSDYDEDENGNIYIEVRNGSNENREDDDYAAGNFLRLIH